VAEDDRADGAGDHRGPEDGERRQEGGGLVAGREEEGGKTSTAAVA
jgi:hypothetical protein